MTSYQIIHIFKLDILLLKDRSLTDHTENGRVISNFVCLGQFVDFGAE